jgi:hypothetical protein
VEPSEEWLMEVKCSSKAIRILSPSTAITCSLRGTIVEALHNPTVETNIMSEFLAEALFGKMPLVSTNKLFKSPLGLFFKCCGIARGVPVIIDKIKVFIYFHFYAILEFDILIGYPLENLIQEKPFHGGLDEKMGTAASATPIPCPASPMVEHLPNHDLFEEAKFISPFISPRLSSEIEHPSSPSLEPKPCLSGHPNIILNDGQDSTLIMHDGYFENAMDTTLSTTSNYENPNHLSNLCFKTFQEDCCGCFCLSQVLQIP